MKNSPKLFINTMFECAKRIKKATENENYSSFIAPNSWIIRDAVARRFLMIAEISDILCSKYIDFYFKYPEIEFSKIRSFKAYLTKIHDTDIDWSIVWETIQTKIPEIIDELKTILRDISKNDD